MAATPKKRHSKSRRNNRRSHLNQIASALVATSKCPNCGVMKTPHKVCWNCGYYRGKLIKRAI